MSQSASSATYPKLTQACTTAKIVFPEHLTGQHPQVAAKLESLWGTREAVALLDNLVFSDRPDRIGFSFDVVRDLFALKDAHELLHPQLAGRTDDPFASRVSDLMRAEIGPAEKLPERAGARKDDAPPERASVRADAPAAARKSKEAGKALPGTRQRAPWPEIAALDQLHDIAGRRARGERLPVRDTRRMMEILREHVALSEEEVDYALGVQKQIGKKLGPIGKVLLSIGVVDAEQVTRVLCLQYGVLMVNLQRFQMPPDVMKLAPLEVVRKYRAAPVAVIDRTAQVAADPDHLPLLLEHAAVAPQAGR